RVALVGLRACRRADQSAVGAAIGPDVLGLADRELKGLDAAVRAALDPEGLAGAHRLEVEHAGQRADHLVGLRGGQAAPLEHAAQRVSPADLAMDPAGSAAPGPVVGAIGVRRSRLAAVDPGGSAVPRPAGRAGRSTSRLRLAVLDSTGPADRR